MTHQRSARVERWGTFEIPVSSDGAEFHGPDGTRYAASFSAAGDGRLLRFMPDTVGEWTYRLDGSSTLGRFTCVPAGEGNHGPVRVHDGTRLRHADGTPYAPLTTTWLGSATGAGDWPQVCRTLVLSPFNRVRTVAPADAEGLSRLDAQVRELREHRIEVEVILFRRAGPGPVDDETHIRQVVSRLAAYRNVSWCLAVDPVPASGRDLRQLAGLVQEYDYGDHLLTVHAPPGDFDAGQPWLTHLSVSLENLRRVSRLRTDYRKPVFVDRCGYEGDAEDPRASLTAAEMVARIWEGTVRGGHVAHGEWYDDGGADEPWSAGGARLGGDSPARLGLLRQVLDEMPDDVEPIEDYRDAPTLATPGRYYLQYLNAHRFGERRFTLPPGSYAVDVIDTWNMTVNTLADPVEAEVTVRLPGTAYQAVRIRRVPC